MKVRGNDSELIFSDVLVGEVWLCSGQSNMEKPLGPRHGQQPTDKFEEEIARANQVPWHGRPREGQDGLRWLPCTPETIRATGFTAAGYFFGRHLLHELGVPVGLIHASFGGSRIEAWTPAFAFERSPKTRESSPYSVSA
ncbi:MAG: sialate O-acetylesterase [Opitutaceae bacterium]